MRTLFLLMQSIQKFLWGIPMLLLLFGTHMYFTVKLHFIQRKLPLGIRWSVLPEKEAGTGGISPFSALATALAATIGTGNIIGISTAIAIGGPGAIFWCWITGVLGIATCYAECYLSVRFRVQKADGSYTGGPMYVMEHALHQKSAAIVFALAVVLVSFGMGSSVQSHSIAAAVNEHWTIDPKVIGILLGGLVGIVILGGVDKITKVCTWLVPFMSCFFLGGCLFLVWKNRIVYERSRTWLHSDLGGCGTDEISIPTEPCVNDRRVLGYCCDVRGYGDRDHRMYDQRTCALFAGGR